MKFPTLHPEEICVLVSAPTGKAAFNVFGVTAHCAFKLPPTQYKGRINALDDATANTLRSKLRCVKLFIIDEVSMVGQRMFMNIDERLRQIFCSKEDFGGKSIFVVGHLRQLPPVGDQPFFAAIGGLVNYLWGKFRLYEFEEIMRQKGDYEFCKALNNMSEGVMDEDDIKLIKSREISKEDDAPENAIWLFAENAQCEQHNSKVHSKLQGDGALSTACDTVTGK